MLHAVVLGAAAGGGFPQWNSNAPACREVRRGGCRARARSQASVALSANERDWFVLNASPDLRLQIEATAVLHPREGLRSSPISGVVATGGDVDAIAGLLHLRERHHFTLFAPARVLDVIAAYLIFGVLAPDYVGRVELRLDETVALAGMAGDAGLAVRAFAGVLGKVPLYLEEELIRRPGAERSGGRGRARADRHRRRQQPVLRPGLRRMTGDCAAAAGADGVLRRHAVADDEMIRAGVGDKTGRRMGHMSCPGTTERSPPSPISTCGSKIFIHINNSNPMLLEDSPERSEAEAAGLGSRLRRHGGAAVTRRRPSAHPGSARSRAARRSAPSAITTGTRFIADARRQAQPRPDAGLGIEPLLLPEPDSGQGRLADGAPADRRTYAANGAPAWSTMTVRTTKHRRHRALAASGRRAGPRSRLCRLDRGLLPATRFAVDAYVNFVRERSHAGGIASSPDGDVLAAASSPSASRACSPITIRQQDTLAYFTPRLTQAPTDVPFALCLCQGARRDGGKAGAVLAALRFKCDVLWAQLDALHFAYVAPGLIPPGAFVPDGARMTGGRGRRRRLDAALCRPRQFRFDQVREAWVVLAPERLFLPDEQAVAISAAGRRQRAAWTPSSMSWRAASCAARHDRRRRAGDAAGPRRQRSGRGW